MSAVIGPCETGAASGAPRVHPAVAALCNLKAAGSAPIHFYPVNLDLKQAECARCVLVDDERSCFVDQWHSGAIPIYLSTQARMEEDFLRMLPPVSVILDMHDKDTKYDFLCLTEAMWEAIARHELRVIYLKLQVHEARRYVELNRLPGRVTVLSWPMLLGGSPFHITVQDDFAGDALFSRTLRENLAPKYEYDWSCIGSITSDDRRAAFEILRGEPEGRGFLTVSVPGHLDANVATVPLERYLQISRSSRVCFSLNGRGPWCLKDGELLANECFIMRQWHPILELNPLSPRDGVHWRVFRNENLVQTMESCLSEPGKIEQIRKAAFGMFRDVLHNHLWSRQYATALMSYLSTGNRAAWAGLAFA